MIDILIAIPIYFLLGLSVIAMTYEVIERT